METGWLGATELNQVIYENAREDEDALEDAPEVVANEDAEKWNSLNAD